MNGSLVARIRGLYRRVLDPLPVETPRLLKELVWAENSKLRVHQVELRKEAAQAFDRLGRELADARRRASEAESAAHAAWRQAQAASMAARSRVIAVRVRADLEESLIKRQRELLRDALLGCPPEEVRELLALIERQREQLYVAGAVERLAPEREAAITASLVALDALSIEVANLSLLADVPGPAFEEVRGRIARLNAPGLTPLPEPVPEVPARSNLWSTLFPV